jgi:hypothetical protein
MMVAELRILPTVPIDGATMMAPSPVRRNDAGRVGVHLAGPQTRNKRVTNA